ncbi:porin [Gallibacterium anatis]|uniref:Porin domain-containing protein n=1 Tax=Gallibacterium anatis 12656/12 TaxID=1195244 RepID=U1I555_9PAST|nr:porin [Gallibacterium anatis]ERF77279.1 hypothetical protein N561_12330 [Gallibacterium anatis 12656/12]KGQ50054.1 membrane protein [Gallibacterium anatis 10672-6]OZN49809.1 porin [Gallibacterium anatis]
MKKTLVALAVAAVAATSANAAVVYNQDGTKVDVGGQVRLLLTKDKNERADLKYGSSRIHAKVNQDLGDGYSALGHLEIGLKGDQDNVTVRRVYAGFAKEGVGQLTFGRQLTNLDDVGVSDYTYDLGGVNTTVTEANKDIRFRSADFAGFQFGLDYYFGDNAKNKAYEYEDENGITQTSSTYDNASGFGVSAFYTVDVANDTALNFEAGYTQTKFGNNGTESPVKPYKQKAFTVGAEVVSGKFALGVDYSQAKATNDKNSLDIIAPHSSGTVVSLPVNKLQQLEVGAKYDYLDNASVYGEYIYRQGKFVNVDEKVKVNEFILGTDYKFAKNVITYFEAGTAKAKFDDKSARDHKVRVGLRVLF